MSVRCVTFAHRRSSQNASPSLSDASLYLQSDSHPSVYDNVTFEYSRVVTDRGVMFSNVLALIMSWILYRQQTVLILFCIIFTETYCGKIWVSSGHSDYKNVTRNYRRPMFEISFLLCLGSTLRCRLYCSVEVLVCLFVRYLLQYILWSTGMPHLTFWGRNYFFNFSTLCT